MSTTWSAASFAEWSGLHGATPEDLNHCIRDLVALSTLPAVWLGAEPVRMAESLAAALFTTLRADFVYVGLEAVDSGTPVRVAQTGRYATDPQLAERLGPRILAWARAHDPDELLPADDPGGRRLWLATRPLGFNAGLGVIAAGFENTAKITPFQYTLLSVGATQAVSAVQNAQFTKDLRQNIAERIDAEQALRDELDLQERLNVFGRKLAAQTDIASTLRGIAESAMSLTKAQAAVFVRNDCANPGDSPRLTATFFPGPEGPVHCEEDAAPLWPLVGRDAVVNVGDVTMGPGVPPHCSALARRMSLRSYLAATIGEGDRTAGALILTHRDGNFFGPRAERVLAGITVQAAVALENVGLHQQRLELIERLRIADRHKDEVVAHLRAIVQTTPACIKLVAQDGTLLDMNAAGLAMVDATRLDEVQGRCVYDLISDEYRAAFQAFNERVCSGAREAMRFEVLGLRGTRRHMETFAAPLAGPDGRLAQLAVTVDVTPRISAEQELRRQAQVLESMVEGVSVADERGIIVYTNPAEDRIFGYERGELLGKHVTVQNDYADEENRRLVGEVIEHLKREGAWSGEFSNRRKDGTRFTTYARITALDTGGKRYFVCVQEDITQRKRAESALADARARLDAALEAGAIATWTWDIPGNRLHADRNLARLFNVPASHADGGPLEDYARSIHEQDLPHVMEMLSRAVETGEDYQAEYRVVQADGSVRWVVARGRAERDSTGRAIRMPGVLVDITARKALEEQLRLRLEELAEANRRKEELLASLRQSEEKLRLLADTIPQLAWMAHPNGDIFWYNRRWYEYTGTKPADMEGWGWQSVHDPGVLPSVLERWRRSIATGEPFDMVFPLRGADGQFRPFLTRVNPLRSADGTILHWFGTNTDISDIKRMEEALREADRRKDEFLATLAHELRNPLAPIRNSLEILRMPRLAPATARQATDMMGRQVQALVRLVDDLLDVARVMRGKIELRKEPVEIATVVSRAVEMVQTQIDAQGHRLELTVPEDSLTVDADPVRLAQVLGNLLSNAAKYTEPSGNISLTVTRSGSEVLLRIADNGIGIAPDILPHIFQLFVQADHAYARAHGGLGIGLTLVKNLVEMHGGTVHAHSAGLGKGSEFSVRLPLKLSPDSKRPAPAGERLFPLAPSGQRLLVVDDNVDAAVSLAALLQLQGYEVAVAHDGCAALDTAGSFRPRAVFLDIGMPGMDGYEVARRMRGRRDLDGIVLVALTGWGQEEDRRRTAAAGFHHHLVKPAEPAALARVLEQLRTSRESA